MQGGDPVGALGEPQPHHGHVEEVGLATGVRLHAELEDLPHVHPGQLAVVAEVAGDELAVEAVDAGRYRSVRGEHRPGPHRLKGGVELKPLTGQFADALKPEEPGVALVGVEHLGRRVSGKSAVRPHRAHSADAEQHLLEQPVLAAAAVQPVGHIAFAGPVLLDVGVEQEQRHPADPGLPDRGVQTAPAGQREADPGWGAVLLAQQGDRQLVGVEHRVVLLLPALARQGLAEVAVPVQEADPDERYAEVAGGFQMVADEDAEAAGVLRQGGGDAELG